MEAFLALSHTLDVASHRRITRPQVGAIGELDSARQLSPLVECELDLVSDASYPLLPQPPTSQPPPSSLDRRRDRGV